MNDYGSQKSLQAIEVNNRDPLIFDIYLIYGLILLY